MQTLFENIKNILSLIYNMFVDVIYYLLDPFHIPKRYRRKRAKSFKSFTGIKNKRVASYDKVKRNSSNPLITPLSYNEWEREGTFNPAVWEDSSGALHMMYRAVGADGVSRLGYAYSTDGVNFQRLAHPVFELSFYDMGGTSVPRVPNFSLYPSGGSWGGVEDPRMVAIGDRIYVTCGVINTWDFVRMAVVSISKADFMAHRWNWSTPILLSPAGEVHKNWVLFPEKINGKFAILHSITPAIQIDYIDSFEEISTGKRKIKSTHGQKGERNSWDSKLRGVGCPPIKTKHGWLVLYHAVDKREPNKYKLGAFLLDIDEPTKILAQCPLPILTPDMWYENEGKAGVVYVSGAILSDDWLDIYYGGGDKYVCHAHIPAKDFFKLLLENRI